MVQSYNQYMLMKNYIENGRSILRGEEIDGYWGFDLFSNLYKKTPKGTAFVRVR